MIFQQMPMCLPPPIHSKDNLNCPSSNEIFHKLTGINARSQCSFQYQSKMDSQLATICSFQQLSIINALQQWAEDLVEAGEKRKLLSVIEAILSLTQLQEIGIGRLGKQELELLNEIVKRTMKSIDDRQLRLDFFVVSEFIPQNFNEDLKEQIEKFQKHSKQAGAKFYVYLKQNCPSDYPCDALEAYLTIQNQVIDCFLLETCKYHPESSISVYFKQKYVEKEKIDRQSQQKNIKKSSKKQPLKTDNSVSKKSKKAENVEKKTFDVSPLLKKAGRSESSAITERQDGKFKKEPIKKPKISPENKRVIK